MLIPDWVINTILFLVTVRLMIWAFVFFMWLPSLYEQDKGIIRFLKKIGRYIVGGVCFLIAGGLGNALLKPLLMQEGNTVVEVKGESYFSISQAQQFFSPDFNFADGSKVEIPQAEEDGMVLLNNSPTHMILWESRIIDDKIEQKRMAIVAPYSSQLIPDEISCLIPGIGLADCMAENTSTAYPSYHLTY
ncbi:MAG: hypothetical protein AAF696_13770 [Bacteroidota bacterium]